MRAESQIAVVRTRIRAEFLCRLGRCWAESQHASLSPLGGLPLPGNPEYFSCIPTNRLELESINALSVALQLAATADADPAPLAVFKDFDVTISRIDKQLFMLCGR